MRFPMIPLITIDPYFSVWCQDKLCGEVSQHWTNRPNTIQGVLRIDGQNYCFWGKSEDPYMEQKSVEVDALSTTFVLESGGVELTAKFTSPLIATDLYLSSRPVSYLKLSYVCTDGKQHDVKVKISVSEELALHQAGESRVLSDVVDMEELSCIRMGNGIQKVLWRSGDNVRIDWGYFYLCARGKADLGTEVLDGKYAIYAEKKMEFEELFLFAYDDISSIEYFGKQLKAYYAKAGQTIHQAIQQATVEYESLSATCDAFARELQKTATQKGGAEYAELLALAYRQVMAAHKLVVDDEGNNLYISKECFSNGCGATVDVTYPSAPMYLYYNPELLKGMLRPIFKYARSEAWKFDFAPHDVGQYPLLNGQVYCNNELKGQMPVEECGNMIILVDAICRRERNYQFATQNLDLLRKWYHYLVTYGEDPDNQLCTDDFAGHMNHNCNLSLKAIMGIVGFADILQNLGEADEGKKAMQTAKAYVASFLERAQNEDGSYRLAYDQPGTFSLKYNCIWDKVWKTNLLPQSFYDGEMNRYKKECLPYGVPLDCRAKYTKSDWLLWAACMADKTEDFNFLVHKMWSAFDVMHSRVPMTDWYHADIAQQSGYFQNRTVQGGLFMKLLID